MRGVAKGVLVVLAWLFGAAGAQAQNNQYFEFWVCNQTNVSISVAVMNREQPTSREWYIQGWWNVDAQSCRSLGYRPKSAIYAHAMGGGKTWSGDTRVCVETTKFKRVNYGNVQCDASRHRGFRRLNVTGDEFTWTLSMN